MLWCAGVLSKGYRANLEYPYVVIVLSSFFVIVVGSKSLGMLSVWPRNVCWTLCLDLLPSLLYFAQPGPCGTYVTVLSSFISAPYDMCDLPVHLPSGVFKAVPNLLKIVDTIFCHIFIISFDGGG